MQEAGAGSRMQEADGRLWLCHLMCGKAQPFRNADNYREAMPNISEA